MTPERKLDYVRRFIASIGGEEAAHLYQCTCRFCEEWARGMLPILEEALEERAAEIRRDEGTGFDLSRIRVVLDKDDK